MPNTKKDILKFRQRYSPSYVEKNQACLDGL